MTLPAVMGAVLLTGYGGYDKLEWRTDVPVPLPEVGDVLIRIGAAAVNNTDINTRIGWYSKAVAEATDAGAATGIEGAGDDGWSGAAFTFPRIQGADACGQIVAVGEGVDSSRIGQRVLVEPVFRGHSRFDIRYFGSEVDGGFAEYARVPSVHAHRIESTCSDVELASFPCAYATAENILTRIGLQAGERVLITGASGGVGSAAVQLAKRRGAEVTAMAADAKAETVRDLGASQVVPRDADLESLFGSEYFDAAVDIVGGGQFGPILNALKRGGRYGVSGAISGPVVDLDLRTLYLKDLRLIGCTVLEPEVFPNLIGYIERGEIKPVVAATYPITDIAAAQEAFLTKRHVGKIVLVL
ncbi:alcohol dehydrogenase family protein [Sphingorhabdus lacus]|uniref:Alcohol dehydrogenase n=1 Tax=Sphingorhabdus lacus TaxID=392610 RepID=A0A6I6L5E3_9SPHN|nr:alcohol dehydrogenase family protein [Sphingorhabdus lacus]QGY79558.1 alcohol dehydrogenase [Sphingorhabdus lacus]